jgi:ferrochelatase
MEGDYTTCYQSRFSKNWLTPFTDEVIREQARAGTKRLLVVSPSFVSDCLETVVEINYEYHQLFRELSDGHLQLVEGLNDGDDWISALQSIIVTGLLNPGEI